MYVGTVLCVHYEQKGEILDLDTSLAFVMLWRFLLYCHLQSNVSEMIDAVKAAFIERLDNNVWLDETTREASKEKVRAITKMIAYPDQLYNDTYLNNLYDEVSWTL